MRLSIIVALAFACSLAGLAQQQNPPRQQVRKTAPEPAQTPPAENPPATPQQQTEQRREQQPSQPREQPPERREETPAPAAGPGEPAQGRPFHFDMTEHAPVGTHHQITVSGKLLKTTTPRT